jgi:hypothetical protein
MEAVGAVTGEGEAVHRTVGFFSEVGGTEATDA